MSEDLNILRWQESSGEGLHIHEISDKNPPGLPPVPLPHILRTIPPQVPSPAPDISGKVPLSGNLQPGPAKVHCIRPWYPEQAALFH